ncbi:MAG TPA: hypothetical protein VHR15_12160 [Ktedonobacterales bacterium]|jgi:hypothetical protein|nr:hypothetical protein [Ktedonobacterales bacterium]
MTAAIRTLTLLVLACLVPAIWLAVEGEHAVQTSRANGGPSFSGLTEALALVVLLIITLIAVTLSGSFAVSNAIARRRGAWTLGLSLALAPTILYVPVFVLASARPQSWIGQLVTQPLRELTTGLDFLVSLLWFAFPFVTMVVVGAYVELTSRELDAERQIRGQRGAITALAIIALVFLLLLWSPLLLTGDAHIDQPNVVLALPVEMLILTIGAVACALAAFSAGLRRQIACASALGAVALAAVIPIVYFFVALEQTSVAPLSDALLALLIFLGTATPPVAALIYCVMNRDTDLSAEDSLAPTISPA